jgi:hypothetical protein
MSAALGWCIIFHEGAGEAAEEGVRGLTFHVISLSYMELLSKPNRLNHSPKLSMLLNVQ